MVMDSGAYADNSPLVLAKAVNRSFGPYGSRTCGPAAGRSTPTPRRRRPTGGSAPRRATWPARTTSTGPPSSWASTRAEIRRRNLVRSRARRSCRANAASTPTSRRPRDGRRVPASATARTCPYYGIGFGTHRLRRRRLPDLHGDRCGSRPTARSSCSPDRPRWARAAGRCWPRSPPRSWESTSTRSSGRPVRHRRRRLRAHHRCQPHHHAGRPGGAAGLRRDATDQADGDGGRGARAASRARWPTRPAWSSCPDGTKVG